MSLFGFAADISRKLFTKDGDAAANIKTRIDESNPGVTGLGVTTEPGIVNLNDTGGSAAAFEKAVLMADIVEDAADVQTAAPTMAANALDRKPAAVASTAATPAAAREEAPPAGRP